MSALFSAEPALWLFLSEPGLGTLLTRELKHRDIIRQKARPERLLMRNADVLVLPSSQVLATKPVSRIALEVLACPVFGRHRIGSAQLDHLASLWLKEKPSELTSAVAGSVFRREDVMRLVQRGLRERGAELSGPPNNPPARLLIVDERFYFGFTRFNHHNASGRSRLAERQGSLPVTIAAAMCFSAKPSQGEVIWDPVVGTGTLLAEAATQAPQSVLIGSDIDAAAIGPAKANLAGTNAMLVHADSCELELKREDITLTLGNLPFGKQFQSGNSKALYGALLKRSLGHAAPSWRAVLLTSDETAIRAAVGAIAELAIEPVATVRVRGHDAKLWLVTRHPN